LQFTHHDAYPRWAHHIDGTPLPVTIVRVRCLECGAVFSIQPSFIVRYKRYDTDAIEKSMTLLFIAEGSQQLVNLLLCAWPTLALAAGALMLST
jgi:hypothetical protein